MNSIFCRILKTHCNIQSILLFNIVLIVINVSIGSAENRVVDSRYGHDRYGGLLTPLQNSTMLDIYNGVDINLGKDIIWKMKQTGVQGSYRAPNSKAGKSDELDRIALGSQPVAGWQPLERPPIWKAALTVPPDSVILDGDTPLSNGNFSHILNEGEWFWDDTANTLYYCDSDGNPDTTGKELIAVNRWLNSELVLTDWTPSPQSIWKTPVDKPPLYVLVDGIVYFEWWWGPRDFMGTVVGEENTLHIIDAEGNPGLNNKEVVAVIDTGGWSVAASDFNGDGLNDVVHSNVNRDVYVNYGSRDFSPLPDQTLISSDGGDVFGFEVASAGDLNADGFGDLLVTVEGNDPRVHIYTGRPGGLPDSPDITLYPPEGFDSDDFGHVISTAGDITADGYADIVVVGGGMRNLFVYHGSDIGVESSPQAYFSYTSEQHVSDIVGLGDINGDGMDDVAVSLMLSAPADHFEVRLYLGSPSGLIQDPQTLDIEIPEMDVLRAGRVAASGDLNDDGYADLLVGNEWAGNEVEMAGNVSIFFGSESGYESDANIILDNPYQERNARFGGALAGIGDFNEDGFKDIAVGCPYGDSGNGFTAIYLGSSNGIETSPSIVLDEIETFGWSMVQVGDIYGDGRNYIAVGEEFGGTYLYALPHVGIDAVIEFYNQGVTDGGIVGRGEGFAAMFRINFFRRILNTAGRMLADGEEDTACRLLSMAYLRCDDKPNPLDMISGEAVPELAKMLLSLMRRHDCNDDER